MADFLRPRGDITTVLDQVSRDEQDNTLFPLDAEETQFATDPNRRIHPFSMSIQEFPYRGSAEYGGKFTFDLGSVTAGDLLLSVLVQVQLQHWLPPHIVTGLRDRSIQYADPANDAYVWAASLGTALIARAELEVGDQVLEQVDGDFANVVSRLFPDMNTQLGIATDALGSLGSLGSAQQQQQPLDFPCGPRGYVTCILPFFFQRTRLKEAFPLLSVRSGVARINITFRPFAEVVQRLSPYVRTDCDDTPVGKTMTFVKIATGNNNNNNNNNTTTFTYQVPDHIPQPLDVRLVTYSAVLTGGLRQAYIRKPHDLLYRETQTFRFTEPMKYKVGTPSSDTVSIQLPLEANGPLEEILWFVRRKGAALQSDWTNYSGTLAAEVDPVFNPRVGLLVSAKIQANGIELVNASADYFRSHIAEKHRGGIVAYDSYIYGYSFAKNPGEHQPSGSINASRVNTLRLTLDIAQPQSLDTQTIDDWEVTVYCMGLNWMRFENGIVNRIYSD
jgi:hypothetical protein